MELTTVTELVVTTHRAGLNGEPLTPVAQHIPVSPVQLGLLARALDDLSVPDVLREEADELRSLLEGLTR